MITIIDTFILFSAKEQKMIINAFEVTYGLEINELIRTNPIIRNILNKCGVYK